MNARNSIKLGVILIGAIAGTMSAGVGFADALNLGNGGVGNVAVTRGLLGGGGGNGGSLLGGGGGGLGGLLRIGHGGALLGSSAGGLVGRGDRGLLGTGLLRNPNQHR